LTPLKAADSSRTKGLHKPQKVSDRIVDELKALERSGVVPKGTATRQNAEALAKMNPPDAAKQLEKFKEAVKPKPAGGWGAAANGFRVDLNRAAPASVPAALRAPSAQELEQQKRVDALVKALAGTDLSKLLQPVKKDFGTRMSELVRRSMVPMSHDQVKTLINQFRP
jgi:hypothetical protein